ncbi:MAG: DUF520 family protein [Nitrospiraceae bacterium]
MLFTKMADNDNQEVTVADQFSFDVVSEVNMQEMKNVVDQSTKEIKQRFDFMWIRRRRSC